MQWEEMERCIDLCGGREEFAAASGIPYKQIYYYKKGRLMQPERAHDVAKSLKKKRKILIDVKRLCGYTLALLGVDLDD